MTNRLLAALAVVVTLTVTATADDERVPNSSFPTLAKHKPGTSVKVKSTFTVGEKAAEAVDVITVVEVKEDRVVIEHEKRLTLDGKEIKTPATKSDVLRNLPKKDAPEGTDPKTGKPAGTTEEGKEKIKISGTEYECRWYKFTQKRKTPSGGEEEIGGQLWLCDDVPGGIVKMVSASKDHPVTVEVIEVTIKK